LTRFLKILEFNQKQLENKLLLLKKQLKKVLKLKKTPLSFKEFLALKLVRLKALMKTKLLVTLKDLQKVFVKKVTLT